MRPDNQPDNPIIVSAKDLSKSYGAIDAVHQVDFEIRKGEIFGLIGPDGAGKTSIFHIMGGIMDKSAGNCQVLGMSPSKARLSVGYLTQQFSLYLDLSVKENIRYAAALRHVSESNYKSRADRLLEMMDLRRFQERLAGNLSGGMKQKLALCCSLVARPRLLLLDEPTTGVDPVSRREFWDILASVSGEGVTIAMATPYLDEAERCSRIALIHEGRIKKTGTPDQLKDSIGLKRLEIRSSSLSRVEQALDREISQISHSIQKFGDRLDLLVENAEHAGTLIENRARALGLDVETSCQRPTLENVFIHSLGQEIEKTSISNEPANKEALNLDIEIQVNSQDYSKGANQSILARGMSKRFGDFWAVKDVSLSVAPGEIFGLLGANGAGKTTSIKMLCGLVSLSEGEMALLGEKKNLRSSSIRKRLGYMSQKFTLYDDLTVLENLEFYCGIYEIPLHLRQKRINWALANCDLSGQESLLTGKLPGGWKQRLAFGACVMHEPEVLFLDEPTSGVDPIARRQLWSLIREFAARGAAILVTTHFLEEAEHCNRMAFMAGGSIVAQGSPGQIKSSQPGKLVELRVPSIQTAHIALKENFARWRVSVFSDKIHLVVIEKSDLDTAAKILESANCHLISTREIPYSLEDAFIGIVERASEGVLR